MIRNIRRDDAVSNHSRRWFHLLGEKKRRKSVLDIKHGINGTGNSIHWLQIVNVIPILTKEFLPLMPTANEPRLATAPLWLRGSTDAMTNDPPLEASSRSSARPRDR